VRALNRQTLKGLWSAVPTPWDERGDIDGGMLARNCEKLASAGVDGIYTTDSDGEFYAIELEEFRRLSGLFGKAMERAGVDAAMGVTWSHTRGVIDRIKAACLTNDWVTAAACHKKLIAWELTHVKPLREAGYLHGIIGKARAALTGFLEDTGRTRPPYYPIQPDLRRTFQASFDAYRSEEIRVERQP